VTEALRVLIVEDSARDAELLVLALERGGYDPTVTRVDSAEGMNAALDRETWDIIISDYSMPNFTGPAALEVLQQRGIDLPFIIVSGTIGEELAVAAMKSGAHDYLMKGNLARLVPAIERERREVAERRNRRQVEALLRDSEEQYRGLVEASPDSITLVDLSGRILRANHQAAVLFGFELPEQMVGLSAFEMIAPDERRQAIEDMQQALQAGSIRNLEYTLIRKDGSAFNAEVTGSMLLDDKNAPRAIVSVARDISERKRAQHVLEYQALHDPLTGLPNRTLLFDRLAQAIRRADRDRTSVALLLIDLDRFKEINDTFGHHFGDALLRELGPRFEDVLRKSDTVVRLANGKSTEVAVARLGGDEFAVLLPTTPQAGAILAAGRILKVFERPFSIEGQNLDVGASIGIALYPEHGSDAEILLKHADVAMYDAKRARCGHSVYDSEKDPYTRSRIRLIGDLRRAIDDDSLELYYQPKADLVSGRIVGVEALVRWWHPVEGFIPPMQIVELAEHTGLIKPLSFWVLGTAIRQCRRWRDAGLDLPVAVNLSARSLHDQQLVEMIAGLLRDANLSPSFLGIEITESAVMVDPERSLEIISRLHDTGISISIDDFGTGYSSLAYLKHLPVTHVKIDRSFVLNMLEDQNDNRIVRATISLAHDLGLTTIAEGIETEAVWERLCDLECDFAQGYYVSPPLPVSDVEHWLQQRRPMADGLGHAAGHPAVSAPP
jgi:diguanylate cyclase (GGDEF)-like protein/PAS domain S-box-containing protein